MSRPRRVRQIWLYDGVEAEWFSVEAVRDYLARWLGWVPIGVRCDLLKFGLRSGQQSQRISAEQLAERLCRMRVTHPGRRVSERRTLRPEIDYELRVLSGESRTVFAIPYDGIELQGLASSLMPPEVRRLDVVNIWFTSRLVCTWDEQNCRYHARVSVYGQPSIISTSGMVVGPARPRHYYLARSMGRGTEPAEDGRFLEYEDPRITDIAKGYAMQAVFFAVAGEPFCTDERCRLFNAHWQEQMLRAQFEGPDFCKRHEQMLAEWAQMFCGMPSGQSRAEGDASP